jgi:hypothetical protein
MLRPAYKLTIGNKLVDTTDEPQASTVTELRVSVDMETPADQCVLTLGQVGGLRPAVDDDAAIELGYADDGALVQVFSGKVVAVEPGLTRTRVVAHGSGQALLRLYVDETYENRTAGEIVRALAGDVGVTVAAADDGIRFPAYVADGRRSAFEHMRVLADLSGLDLYTNAEGELVLQRFAGGNTVHVLE